MYHWMFSATFVSDSQEKKIPDWTPEKDSSHLGRPAEAPHISKDIMQVSIDNFVFLRGSSIISIRLPGRLPE
jgi:hypothetical protein